VLLAKTRYNLGGKTAILVLLAKIHILGCMPDKKHGFGGGDDHAPACADAQIPHINFSWPFFGSKLKTWKNLKKQKTKTKIRKNPRNQEPRNQEKKKTRRTRARTPHTTRTHETHATRNTHHKKQIVAETENREPRSYGETESCACAVAVAVYAI
jgi:hypothetical protein